MTLDALLPHAEALGAVAAVFSTTSFFPQVLKTLRTRHAGDFSWAWLAVFGAGTVLWTGYGLILGAAAIVVTNVVIFACVAAIGAVKLAYPAPPPPEAAPGA